MIKKIEERLQALVENRTFVFKDTNVDDAMGYLKTLRTFEGYSGSEMDEKMKILGISFPASYRDFLSVFGKKRGVLFEGSELCVDEVISYRKSAQEIVDEYSIESRLNSDSVVFMHTQGISYHYMRGGASDDDRIYCICENAEEEYVEAENIWSFVESNIDLIEKNQISSRSSGGYYLVLYSDGTKRQVFPKDSEPKRPLDVGDQFISDKSGSNDYQSVMKKMKNIASKWIK